MNMQIYKSWLQANGVRFDEQSFGLAFRYQGCNFIIHNPGGDEQYLSISMPNIYEVENNETQVLRACNQITSEVKAVKVCLRDEQVWLHIEMFIDKTPDIEDFMERLLDILMESRMRFAQALKLL